MRTNAVRCGIYHTQHVIMLPALSEMENNQDINEQRTAAERRLYLVLLILLAVYVFVPI